jgi:epoxide hydrolase-like predicted phosphatase
MAIKAIIFDMEGVLMINNEIDLSACWAKALNVPYDAVHDIFYGEMNDKADLGVVSQADFDRYLITTLGLEMDMLPVVQKVIDEECFIDQVLVDRILELKQKYKIGLLSNYTEMMRDKIENEWKITHLFDDIIISYEVGLIKPDPEIFQLALTRLGVSAAQAVLIDDRIKNIDGAREFGLHAIHYQTREKALRDLEKLIDTQE